MQTAGPYTVVLTAGVSPRSGKRITVRGLTNYVHCDVVYPAPILSDAPPLVFVTPVPGMAGKGVAKFTHVGSPGAWSGFRVVCAVLDIGRNEFVGGLERFPYVGGTGLNYHVCVFGDPTPLPGSGDFGLRLFGPKGEVFFDSRAAFVPFRSLLSNWAYRSRFDQNASVNFVGTGGYYDYFTISNGYWGNGNWNWRKQCDQYMHYFTHPWGVADGSLGVLVSAMHDTQLVLDNGYDDHYLVRSGGIIGWRTLDRAVIDWSLPIGAAQHAGFSAATIDSFGILTADFSRVPPV